MKTLVCNCNVINQSINQEIFNVAKIAISHYWVHDWLIEHIPKKRTKIIKIKKEIHEKWTTVNSRPIAGRSFPIAAAILWNTLPVDIQSFPSQVFRQRLKTSLFHKSFPDVVWQADYAFVDLVMAYCYFSHVKNFLIVWLIEWHKQLIGLCFIRCTS